MPPQLVLFGEHWRVLRLLLDRGPVAPCTSSSCMQHQPYSIDIQRACQAYSVSTGASCVACSFMASKCSSLLFLRLSVFMPGVQQRSPV